MVLTDLTNSTAPNLTVVGWSYQFIMHSLCALLEFNGRVGRGHRLLYMDTLSLTVRVHDLSPRVTLADLNIFFSYCGSIHTIELQRNEERSQLAFVPFKQPYAFQTALLLNGAIIVDRPVRVLALQDSEIPISYNMNDETQNNEKQGFIPAVQSAMQVMASKGVEILNRSKDEIEGNRKLARSAMAGRINAVMVDNDYISTAALCLSGLLAKASKRASQIRDNLKLQPIK